MNRIHDQLSGGRVILASGSPRRKQILEEQLGFKNITVIPSLFKEDLNKDNRTPFQYVLDTATEKALDVYRSEIDADKEPSIVLAADTIVVAGELILEKPKSPAHHFDMLKHIRDSPFPHKVYTAVVAVVPFEVPITPGYALETYIEESIVHFDKALPDEFLRSYVESGEGADAAGGYKIQGRGAVLVRSIDGDFFNVMGLPVNGTYKLIERTIKTANNEEAGLGDGAVNPLAGELGDDDSDY